MTRSVISFTPGPVHVRPEVLAAMATPPLPHRSPAFREVVGRVQQGLADLLATRSPVVPVLSSATGAFEAALAGVARRRVLALVNGSFGERWAAMSEALGFETERVEFPPGEPVDPDVVARALADGRCDTVTFVHSETSTGALSDLGEVAAAVRDAGAALVADAVSSLGVLQIGFDTLGPDAVLVGSTGKGLACPPGMAVLAVGPGAAGRARRPGVPSSTLRLESLLACHAKGETPQTPATSLFHALDVQLGHILAEGTGARESRHREMAALAEEWAGRRGLTLFPAAGARSPAVTVIENAPGFDIGRVLAEMEDAGWRIADGHGAFAGATFRVGHMGDVTPAGLAGCLAALGRVLDGQLSGR